MAKKYFTRLPFAFFILSLDGLHDPTLELTNVTLVTVVVCFYTVI